MTNHILERSGKMKLISKRQLVFSLGLLFFGLFSLFAVDNQFVTIGSEKSAFSLKKEDYYGTLLETTDGNLFVWQQDDAAFDKCSFELRDNAGQVKYTINTQYFVINYVAKDGAFYTCEIKFEPDYATRYAKFYKNNPIMKTFSFFNCADSFQIIIRKYVPGKTGSTIAESQPFYMQDGYSFNRFYMGVYNTKAVVIFSKPTEDGIDMIFVELPFASDQKQKIHVLPNAFESTFSITPKFRDDGVYFYCVIENNIGGEGLFKFDLDKEQLKKIWDPQIISNPVMANHDIDFEKWRIVYTTFADLNDSFTSDIILNIKSMQDGKKIIEPEQMPHDLIAVGVKWMGEKIYIWGRNRANYKIFYNCFLTPKN